MRMIAAQADSTDRELLDEFIRDRDADAFRGLVSRHGAAVHRVCRGVLRDPHEAEDAFQATFLVLASKATVIRDPEAIGSWLREVARRVSVQSRRRALRRKATERARAEMSRDADFSAPTAATFELRKLVRDELDRLPDSYRRPIELCYLDGLTHQEAARRLDWPVGTVKVRLVRGRRLLRERLDRRRVALGAGLLALMPSGRSVTAAAGPLADSTERAMSLASAGRLSALRAEYARAWEMAERASRLGPLRVLTRLRVALALAAIAMLLAVPVARAFSGAPAPEVNAATLPGNLTDVLNVECR